MTKQKTNKFKILLPISISIIFIAVVYLFYAVYAQIQVDKYELENTLIQLNEEDYNNFLKENDSAVIGKKIFKRNCKACHGVNGEGNLTGPNLRDRFWIKGDGSLQSIYSIIYKGTLNKGMPSWGKSLSSDEMFAITKFVKELQSTNLGYGKAPQGIEIK